MIGGADLSEYQQELDPGLWRHIQQNYGPIATIQAWGGGPTGWGTNDFFRHQADRALAAGMDLSTYVVIHWTNSAWPGHVQVDQALDHVGALQKSLLFVAIDIETHTGWATSGIQYRIPRVLEAIDAVRRRGLYPIIYTSRGMWTTVMNGTPQDWGLIVNQGELWYAHYDGKPDFSDGSYYWYPWPGNRVIGKQYGGASALGDSFDTNIWNENFINARRSERNARLAPPAPAPPPIPSPVPTPAPAPAPVYTKAEVDAKWAELERGYMAAVQNVKKEVEELKLRLDRTQEGLRHASGGN